MLVRLSGAGAYHEVEATRAPRRGWTQRDDAQLRYAYETLHLDGAPLHRWCLREGMKRTRGEIDLRLIEIQARQQPVRKHSRNPAHDEIENLCYAPWHSTELETLKRGAIDLDLRNQRLEGWLKKEGIFRLRKDITAKLKELGYQHRPMTPERAAINRVVAARYKADQKAAAKTELAHQIALAKTEATTAPAYRNGGLEW